MRKPPLQPGEKFHRLTVLRFSHRNPDGHRYSVFECECGTEKTILEKSVRYGRVKSCGCMVAESNAKRNRENRTHGMSRTPEYQAFWHAKLRCTDPNNHAYKDYGERGIRMVFESFEDFFAEVGPRPTAAHTLDRIDNERGYEPGNVKWSTMKEQTNNRRPPKPFSEWNVKESRRKKPP